MQETWVQSLDLEDPKLQGATKPMHNNGTHALQLLKPWGPMCPASQQEKALQWEDR